MTLSVTSVTSVSRESVSAVSHSGGTVALCADGQATSQLCTCCNTTAGARLLRDDVETDVSGAVQCNADDVTVTSRRPSSGDVA